MTLAVSEQDFEEHMIEEPDLLDPVSWVRPDVLDQAQKRFSLFPGGQPSSVDDLLVLLVLAAHADEGACVRLYHLGLGHVTFSVERRAALVRHLSWALKVDLDAKPVQDILSRAESLWTLVTSKREMAAQQNTMLASCLEPLLPPGLKLDRHQVEAIAFFEKNKRMLLADEMGLGKTVVALCSMLLHLYDVFPVLVICPLSMPYTWEREAKKWLSSALERQGLPPLVVLPVTSTRDIDRDLVPNLKSKGSLFVITSYDQSSLHTAVFQSLSPRTLICDESHYLKNVESQRTRSTLRLRSSAMYRMLLSGTPMPNGRPKEIFPQIRILDEHAFESKFGVTRTMRAFQMKYCAPTFMNMGGRKITTFNGRSNESELGIDLAPYMLRRTKVEAGMNLGTKTRYRIDLRLSPDEMSKIEQLRLRVSERVQARFEAEVQRLVDRGVDLSVAEDKAKAMLSSRMMEELSVIRIEVGKLKARWSVDLVQDIIEEGHRIIVFTAHHEVADLAYSIYAEKFGEDRVAQCFSDTIGRERDEVLRKAIRSGVSVLVLPRAYREGLTMVEFDRMMMLERFWISGEEVQAEDRIHRRGQDKEVGIYYPHAPGTTDDAMAELLLWKEEGQQQIHGAAETRIFEWLSHGSVPKM